MDILDHEYDRALISIMNIDTRDIVSSIDAKLKILDLSRFKYNSSTNCQTYVDMIDNLEEQAIVEELTTQEIIDIVENKSF